jgi:hypothetical protein
VEETLCLLAAAVIGAALAAAWLLPALRRLQVRVPESLPATPPLPAPPIGVAVPPARPALEPRALAGALADQLSSIASGVDGHAHLLLEAAPDPAQMARAAAALWDALAGLRLFHGKLRAFAVTPSLVDVAVPIEPVLDQLRRELGRRELGLTFAHHLPRSLPPVRGDSSVLHDALLLLCGALLQLERGARRITVDAETRFDGREPGLVLEIRAEWDEDPSRKPAEPLSQAALELDYGAARNLLAAMGGSMEVLRTRGHAARALVHLRAAPIPIAPSAADATMPDAPVTDAPATAAHRFGGVILLENDPALRSMLAQELKAAGRAVFACADDAAARSLLAATPDRFELLILDQDARLEAGDRLAAAAARLCPGIKVCLLGGEQDAVTPAHLAPRLHRLNKPFGLPELRSALSTILGS